MNNQELELRIKEFLSVSNYVDMVEQVVEFEKEYKATDFFKKTKKSLVDVIKEARFWYVFDNLRNKLQFTIDSLDLTKVNDVLNQVANMYSAENENIIEALDIFKELVK